MRTPVGLLLAGASLLTLSACFDGGNPTLGKGESADATRACFGFNVIEITDKTMTVGEDRDQVLRITHEVDGNRHLATVGADPSGNGGGKSAGTTYAFEKTADGIKMTAPHTCEYVKFEGVKPQPADKNLMLGQWVIEKKTVNAGMFGGTMEQYDTTCSESSICGRTRPGWAASVR